MSKTEEKPRRPGIGRRIVNLANPYVQARGTYRSMKNTVMSGAKTIKDMNDLASESRRNPRVRTYRQALDRRPKGALPLAQIAKMSLNAKRLALFFGLISLAFSVGALLSGLSALMDGAAGVSSFLSAILGLLFSGFCAMVAVKYQLRIWQLKVGPTQPDEPLGSVMDLMKQPGWIWQTLDPDLNSK